MLRLVFDFSVQDDIKAVPGACSDSLNSALGGYIFLIVETVQFSNKHFQINCTLEKADGLLKCDSFFFFFF